MLLIEWGSVADWLSGIVTSATLIVTIYLILRDGKKDAIICVNKNRNPKNMVIEEDNTEKLKVVITNIGKVNVIVREIGLVDSKYSKRYVKKHYEHLVVSKQIRRPFIDYKICSISPGQFQEITTYIKNNVIFKILQESIGRYSGFRVYAMDTTGELTGGILNSKQKSSMKKARRLSFPPRKKFDFT